MYICDKCGELRDDFDLSTYKEAHGEKLTDYSCGCGGEFQDAVSCEVCGKYIKKGRKVCDDCLEDYETVGVALEIGEESKVEVPINSFISEVLSESQINKILTKWVEENFTDHSKAVKDFLHYDFSWFEDYVKKEEGK